MTQALQGMCTNRFISSAPLTGLQWVRFHYKESSNQLFAFCSGQKQFLWKLTIISYICLGSGCQPEKITLKGWDTEQWNKDKDGCLGLRSKQWQSFRDKRHQFIGISENQLRGLVGIPAGKELMERGQKIYRYYLVNGAKCGGKTQQISLRVSAMHTVTEVTEE